MQIVSVPEEIALPSALKVCCPELEVDEFDPKYRSPWIQTIGKNPVLLDESTSSPSDTQFNLIEGIFDKYNWIPREYVRLGSQKFMEKYCLDLNNAVALLERTMVSSSSSS